MAVRSESSIDALSDAELILRFQRQPRPTGDERSRLFTLILARHQLAVHGFLLRKLRGEQAADEVMQVSIADAYKLLSEGKGPANPDKLGAWICEVAKRRAAKHISRQAKRGHREIISASRADKTTPVNLGDDEERLAEVWRIVSEVAETLTPIGRETYRYRFEEFLNHKEAARRLGISKEQSHSRVEEMQRQISAGFYAYLLVKEPRCPKLKKIIAKQGKRNGPGFTGKLRKEVFTHYDKNGCASCSKETKRFRLEYAPALIPFLYYVQTRDKVLDTLQTVAYGRPTGGATEPATSPSARVSGAGPGAGLGAAAIIGVLLFANSSAPPQQALPPSVPGPSPSVTLRADLVADVDQCTAGGGSVDLLTGKPASSVRLPDRSFLKPGTSVTGAIFGFGVHSKPHYIIGPEGTDCGGSYGFDGTSTFSRTTKGGQTVISGMMFAGGAVNPTTWGCKYIDAIAQQAEQARPSLVECDRPPNHVVEQLETGTQGFHAALVYTPAADQSIWGPQGETVALYVSTESGEDGASFNGQSITCSLYQGEDTSCDATLGYFLNQTGLAAGVKKSDMRRLTGSVNDFIQTNQH